MERREAQHKLTGTDGVLLAIGGAVSAWAFVAGGGVELVSPFVSDVYEFVTENQAYQTARASIEGYKSAFDNMFGR